VYEKSIKSSIFARKNQPVTVVVIIHLKALVYAFTGIKGAPSKTLPTMPKVDEVRLNIPLIYDP